MPEKQKQIKVYVCSKCKHEWQARKYKDEKPLICPKCKSAGWDRE